MHRPSHTQSTSARPVYVTVSGSSSVWELLNLLTAGETPAWALERRHLGKKGLVQNANFINVDLNGAIYVCTCSFRAVYFVYAVPTVEH